MINGIPEFSDLVYDFIKSRYPSASKNVPDYYDGAMDIFVDGEWVCQVNHDKIYSYSYPRTEAVLPTDPLLFDKIVLMCTQR